MQKIITKIEKLVQKSHFFPIKWILLLFLVFLQFINVLRHFFYLLIFPPQKSFALLHNQDDCGSWKGSYYSHRKLRHNVRFGSVSFTLLTVAVVLAVNFIFSMISPVNQVEIAYADTYAVNNLNDSGPASLRGAIAQANAHPGPDLISCSVTGTVTLASKISINDNAAVTINCPDLILNAQNLVSGAGVAIASDNATVSGLTVSNAPAAGIAITSDPSSVTLDDITLTNNTTNGLAIDGATDSTFSNLIVQTNGQEGIIINGLSNSSIENSTISNNGTNGVEVLGTISSSTLSDNDIYSNGSNGVYLNSITDFTINSNNIYSNATRGIMANAASDVTISNNSVYSNDDNGIHLTGSSSFTLSGNYVGTDSNNVDLGNGNVGIALAATSVDNIIGPNNYVLYNDDFGVSIDGATSLRNTITENIINDNDSDQIKLLSNANNGINVPTISAANGGEIIGVANAGTVEAFDLDNNTYLGSSTIANNSFTINLGIALNNGTNIALTVTDLNGNTSAFATTTIDAILPTVTASPTGGNYDAAQTVSLAASEEADIYYSTDGNTPTTLSTLYSEAIAISETTTLKFLAVDNNNNESEVETEVYTINIESDNDDEDDDSNNDNNNEDNDDENNDEDNDDNDNGTEQDPISLTNFKINDNTVDEQTDVVRISDTTPTFKFANFAKQYVDEKVKIILKVLDNTALTLKATVKKTGRAKLTVPDDDALDIGSYKVYTGIVDSVDDSFKVNLEVIDEEPDLSLIPSVITQESFLIKSTADQVIASLHDVDTDEKIVHAISNDAENGLHTISEFPYYPNAGEFSLQARGKTNDVFSETVSKNIILTPNQYIDTFTTVSTEDNFYKRLTYVENPKIVGLVQQGQNVFINDNKATIQQPCTDVCSWVYEMSNTEIGIHTLEITYKKQGETLKQESYKFRRDLPAVTPMVASHEDGLSFIEAPVLTLIGHANDILYIFDKDDKQIKETTFNDQGAYSFNTALYATTADNYSFNFQAKDGSRYSQKESFTFTLREQRTTAPDTSTIPATEEAEPSQDEQDSSSATDTDTSEDEHDSQDSENKQDDQEEAEPSQDEQDSSSDTDTDTDTSEDELQQRKNDIIDIIKDKNQKGEDLNKEDLPNLTDEVIGLTEKEKEKLITDLNQQKVQVDIVLDDEVLKANEVLSNGALKYVIENDLGAYLRKLFNLERAIVAKKYLIAQGQIPKSDQMKNLPAYVILSIYSDPQVHIAQTDSNGEWKITVPLELLPAGQHTAFAQTEINGVKSDQVELVKFVVEEDVKFSKTTWLVIINVVFALMLIMAVIILQLIKNKKLKNNLTP